MTLIGLGGFPLQHVSLKLEHPNRVVFAPSMSDLLDMNKSEIAAQLAEFELLDAVVWRLSGEDPNLFIWHLRLLGLLNQFRNRTFKAAFWTMDSHHMLSRELRAVKHFDHIFVAHSPYLQHFPKDKSTFLPCSVSIESKADLLAVNSNTNPHELPDSCVALFANYPGQKRNLEFSTISEQLEELGVDYFFGTARGGATPNRAMIEETLKHKVVINLSLADDLNMRNFEALALDRILLTNSVPDLHILEEWKNNIVVFKRDMSDFREKVSSALKLAPEPTSATFLAAHHISNRVEKIVSTLFPQIPTKVGNSGEDFSGLHKEKTFPATVKRYGFLELLASSGIYAFRLRNVKKVLVRFGPKPLLVFFIGAIRAGLIQALTLTIGKLSWFRAGVNNLVSRPRSNP